MRVGRRVVDALRSPRRLFAFVARVVRLTFRGELASVLTRIQARGATVDEYRRWAARAPSRTSEPPVRFLVAVDLPDASAARQLVMQLRGRLAGASAVVARSGDRWATADDAAPRSLGEWLAVSDAEWLLWIVSPLTLANDALPALSEGCAVPDARIVYADRVEVDEQDVSTPVFLSAWDRIRIAESPYPSPLVAVHASLAHCVDVSTGGVAGQWRTLIEAVDALPEAQIVHVPRVAVRVTTRDEAAIRTSARVQVVPDLERLANAKGAIVACDATRTPWITYRERDAVPVSVVIPTRDRPDLVERCVRSVLSAGWSHGNEIVVVDNGSSDPKLAEVLRALSRVATVRTLRMDIPFNFPALCNAGVQAASGRAVVLLNNDAEVGTAWLDELVPLALRNDVGAVGPLVVYPDGRIQSAGVLVGVNRTATSALEGFDAKDRMAIDWCGSRRRVSAVLGACVAIERSKYLEVGGMDPQFAVSLNEVDFCLRLEAAGLANVFTPFARVVHEEGATRGFEVTAAERARLDDEETRFIARWTHVLDAPDPAHHPAFSRTGNPFLLGSHASVMRPRAGWRHG